MLEGKGKLAVSREHIRKERGLAKGRGRRNALGRIEKRVRRVARWSAERWWVAEEGGSSAGSGSGSPASRRKTARWRGWRNERCGWRRCVM